MAEAKRPKFEKYPFWQIWDKGVKQGLVPGQERKAREWFRNEAKKAIIGPDVRADLLKPHTHFKRSKPPIIGFMYMFEYDALWKAKLPYWDKFPLVFPFDVRADRFTGINLHYLNRPMRARLMDALHNETTNSKYNDSQQVKKEILNYQVLKAASRFRHFEPTIHTYLISQLKSPLYKIPGEYWDIALFLPTERFQKSSKTQVWKDSAKQITSKWTSQGNRR